MQRKEEGVEGVLLGNKKIGRQDRRETSDLETKFEVVLKRHEKVLDIMLIMFECVQMVYRIECIQWSK
jgi:hypothetical protein